MTSHALPLFASGKKRNFFALAMRARYLAVRPAERDHEIQAAHGIGKVGYCPNESYFDTKKQVHLALVRIGRMSILPRERRGLLIRVADMG